LRASEQRVQGDELSSTLQSIVERDELQNPGAKPAARRTGQLVFV
jgi:hypothetical protein